MAATKTRTSSFSRNFSAGPSSLTSGLKNGPNGTVFVSSGIPDLDSILSFPLDSRRWLSSGESRDGYGRH